MEIFDNLELILADVSLGNPIIIIDNPNRKNEGDIFVAAEKISPEKIGFMRRYATGLICVSMNPKRLEELGLELMVPSSYSDRNRCRFTFSVDYKHGVTSGISDYDRTTTIRALIDPKVRLKDFYIPGHVFPLRAEKNGVREREGHTEASVDLAKFAGLYPAGVICEVIKEDGTMARVPGLIEFSKRHNIKICTIEQVKSIYK